MIRKIDEEKIKEDVMYDGYFCIITSELDYDYKRILEVYGSLWRTGVSVCVHNLMYTNNPLHGF